MNLNNCFRQLMKNRRRLSLGKYLTGGIKEISALAFPMMLIPFFTNLMVFLDRLILGRYSIDAMNAVAAAASAVSPLTFSAWSIATIAEVFVGQLYGAKRYGKMAQPVWQMIWFSLFLGILFLPIAFWAGPYVLPPSSLEKGLSYYQWVMATGFLIPLNAALSSFFSGAARIKIIVFSVIAGTSVNLILDLLLIPSFETQGAGIATAIGTFTQTLILGVLFLKQSQNNEYPPVWRFCSKTLKDCLSIGGPNAISYLIEMGAWYAMFMVVDKMGFAHVTILQMGYSLYTLFSFLPDGLQKGVVILASNSIGRQRFGEIHDILKSSIKVHLILMAFLGIPFLLLPEQCIKIFLGSELSHDAMEIILVHGRIALIWVWCSLFCDDLGWIISGVLTAAGDTKFVMKLSCINVSCFWLLPVHGFLFILKDQPSSIWGLVVLYGVMNVLLYFRRYKRGKWKNVKISSLILDPA